MNSLFNFSICQYVPKIYTFSLYIVCTLFSLCWINRTVCHAQQTSYQQAKTLVTELTALSTSLNEANYTTLETKNRELGKVLLQDAQAKQDFLADYRKFAKQLVQFRQAQSQQNIARLQQRIQAHQTQLEQLQRQLQTDEILHQVNATRLEDFIAFTQQFHREIRKIVEEKGAFSKETLAQYPKQLQWGKAQNHPSIQRISQQVETLYALSQNH